MQRYEEKLNWEKIIEEYWVVVLRRSGGAAEVIRDGRAPQGRGMRHRIGAEDRARYAEQERGLARASGGAAKATRLMWHYLRQRRCGDWIEIPHVSYIRKRTLERIYRSIYGNDERDKD